MNRRELEAKTASVDWGRVKGAYGASDGEYDVPSAIRALADEDDVDSERFMEAIHLFWSHVWHQGSIFEVAAPAVPFLFHLVAMKRGDARLEIAGVLVAIADSATSSVPSGRPEDEAISARVVCEIEQFGEDLASWTRDQELAGAAALLALSVPALRGPHLALLEAKPSLDTIEWVALARIADPPPWIGERARGSIASLRGAEAIAAGLAIAAAGLTDPALEEIFSLGAAETLRRAIPFSIQLPPLPAIPTTPFRGELVEAEVIFVGPNTFTVEIPNAGSAMIRWPNAGVKSGDKVRVGGPKGGRPRVVEVARADGSIQRREFGAQGEPLG